MICSSFAYPNMFDVARGKVNLYNNAQSIMNRVKLLLLTDPTEMHMNPNFGVGLRKYMFTYNNDNTVALIRDNLIDQLRLWEPAVVPEDTKVARGASLPEFAGSTTRSLDLNHLSLDVTLVSKYDGIISFTIDQSDIERY